MAYTPPSPENTAQFLPSVTVLAAKSSLTTVQLNHDSYVKGTAQAPRVTHTILNPPYRKITTCLRERTLLASVGIEISTLYAVAV